MHSAIKSLCCAVVLLFAVLMGNVAIAQDSFGETPIPTPTENKVQQPAFDASGIINQVINQIINSVEDGFQSLSNSPSLEDAGNSIMYMLMAVMLAWAGLKSMLGNGISSFFEETVVILIMMAVIQALLASGGIDGIEKFINGVASSIAGSDMSNLRSTLDSTIKKTFNAVVNILSMPSISSASGWSVGQILTAIPQMIAQIFSKMISAMFLVMASGIFIANVIIAYGSIMIAKALAPILIPWLLLPSASFLFDGWLKFFLGSCMFKVVGAFFVKLTESWVSGIADISVNVKVGTEVDAVALFAGNMLIYAAIIMMSATAAYLMMQIPIIAPGIVSGSSRAGFTGLANFMGGAGGGAIKNSSSRYGGAVGGGAKFAARAGANFATKFGGGGGGGGGAARSPRQGGGARNSSTP
ncbi:type IV secretion system protein [Comamonas thiooxydans]|uniref:type IV secretion system protein n=1 Tax=Comamonas thiooxydans TaxID=363952 RepID=UPI0009B8FD2E|nr:type IV secretion system protein [Comamonas thiooxydans]